MSFSTALARLRLSHRCLFTGLGLLFAGCNVEPDEVRPVVDGAAPGDTSEMTQDVSAAPGDASAVTEDADVVMYPSEDAGVCARGVPRCVDAEHYRSCQDNGQWGPLRSCAGYAEQGGGGNCADLEAANGELWAVCMEPVCWHWLQRGVPEAGARVGVCYSDEEVRPCRDVGTFSRALMCRGTCTRITAEDGVELGYCTPQEE